MKNKQEKSIDLSIQIGSLKMKNPVMTASGTCGYGLELSPYMNLSKLGALCVKGLTLKPRLGNPPLRTVQMPAAILNSIGYQNIGIDVFENEKLAQLKPYNVPIVINFLGDDISGYQSMLERLNHVDGISAVEVNVSCPNVAVGGLSFGSEPKLLAKLIKALRIKTDYPLIVKLGPMLNSVSTVAKTVEDAGADAVCLVNVFPAMAIDVVTRRPKLGNIVGGLSGAAIYPIALKLVFEAASAVKIPVIGVGGIASVDDALAMLIAGASVIQIGSAQFANPKIAETVVDGIYHFCKQQKIQSIRSLIGSIEINPASKS